jgi:hypothetical protein
LSIPRESLPPAARRSRVLPVAAFALLVLAAYADPLFLRRNFIGRDLLVYNLPIEKSVHDAWAAGTVPVWSPDVSGGRPLAPNPNAGFLYPVRLLLAPARFPLAMRLYPVLHWIAAGAGMILLLTSLGASRGAAVLGASTYVFSGAVVSEVYFTNFLPGVTLVPWSLWALIRPGRSPARRLLGLAVVYALMFLAGDVFTSVIAIGAGALWILTEEPRETRRAAAGRLAAAVGLGALLAAPQILATGLMVPETHRAVIGMKLDEVFAFSVKPWRLLELVVPYPFGARWSNSPIEIWGTTAFRFLFASLYCGAAGLIGILQVSLRPAGLPGARFARALAAAAVVLAVPPSLAPKAVLAWPSFIPLRYPEKFCIALVFALAVAAGLAAERWRAPGASRFALAVAAVLAAATLLAARFPAGTGEAAAAAVGATGDAASRAARSLPSALSEAGLAWAFAALALAALAGSLRWRAAGFAVLALLPVAANRRAARTESEEAIFTPTPFARALARRDPRARFRTLDESPYRPPSAVQNAALPTDPGSLDYSRRVWYLHTQGLWSRGTVFNSDLDVGDLSRVDSLRRYSSAAATLPTAGALFASVSLRFGIRYRDQDVMTGYAPFGGDGLQSWDENRLAAPDIRLLERWREVPDALAALAAMPKMEPGDLMLETERVAEGTARPGKIRVLEKSPGRLRLDVSAPDPCWLFVLRGFWNHRDVTLDGREVETVPAQIAFTAVAIPRGEHRLDWLERVPGGQISWAGPLAFAVVALGLLRRERGRATVPAS